MKKVMTVVFIEDKTRMLLGRKKRGFGEGKWNGFGGKVDPDETIIDGAIRELQEEAGITATDLVFRGTITFHLENDTKQFEVHFYSGTQFTGEVTESEEMEPRWFDKKKLPYDTMWPEDRVWMPWFFAGKNFGGECWYNKEMTTVEKHTLKVL